MKTLTALIFIFCSLAAAFSGGNGSPQNPYQISSTVEMYAVRNNLAASYILINDIDMYAVNFPPLAYSWEMFFNGTFDGNNNVIKNLTMYSDGQDLLSLFGNIGSRGVVKNLGLNNVRIEAFDSNFSAAIAGWCSGKIENCFVAGVINGYKKTGGIVAGLGNKGHISNCFSYCAVNSVNEIAGGIAADISGEANIEKCFTYGNTYSPAWAGAIAGRIVEDTENKCCFYDNSFTVWSALGSSINKINQVKGNIFDGICDENKWKISTDSILKGKAVLQWVDGEDITSPFIPVPNVAGSTNKLDSITPGALWPDTEANHINAHNGSILSHGGIYYWFGQYMVEGNSRDISWVGVSCYSSKDLYNWKKEAIALNASDDIQSEIAKGCILNNPAVIYNNSGKFVMWFHLEPAGCPRQSAKTGVAISDKPEGPYQYLYCFNPNANFWPDNISDEQKIIGSGALSRDFVGGQKSHQMSLFLDDDTNAYQIYKSENELALHISLLSNDYLRPMGKYVRVFEGRGFSNANIFKRNERYYLLVSDRDGKTLISSSDSIWGQWSEPENICRGDNADKTFFAKPGDVFKSSQNKEAFVMMAERPMPHNTVEGRYVWLPILFNENKPVVNWEKQWDLSIFDKSKPTTKKSWW